MSKQQPPIIEAEIVDTDTSHAKRAMLNGGEPVHPTVICANEPPHWHTPGDHARRYGDRGGRLGGFLVLAVGFVVTAVVLLFSVCILIPFHLLLRVLGVHRNK